MIPAIPRLLDPAPWLGYAATADGPAVERAMCAAIPGPAELAALLSPAAGRALEAMAERAGALTRQHFGRTISLYVPLYLSNYCSGGCAYCGFASDRKTPRRKLTPEEIDTELREIKRMGFEEILLLTGERTLQAGFDYLLHAVQQAARHFHNVTVEAFPMTVDEYRQLGEAGCTGVTLYQETYDAAQYDAMHRWGPKRDYEARLDAPDRALTAGLRTIGLGSLLGLSAPVPEAISLFLHAGLLRRRFWRSGLSISFPRLCVEAGGFSAPYPIGEAFLAQMIFAFRICLPDVPLVLSTREGPRFRDGIAGVGISKMSVASRTTVGGYHEQLPSEHGQFDVNDRRDVDSFCAMLRGKDLEPVFKNWDAVYR